MKTATAIGVHGMTDSVVTILLVDDDKVDTMAVRRAFQALKFSNPVIEVRNGIQALERLRGGDGQEKLPWPYLVLLDLAMPRMGGFELLEIMRDDPELRRVPVFVMSRSAETEDRLRAYDMNIAGFIPKQAPSQSFLKAAGMLQHFVRVNEFPE
jgi:CheY-like chemotaxis protein